MPAEYLKCVESLMSEGKSKAEAQKICAIAYYKKHGKTPQEAEKMAEFKAYKTDINKDGSINIRDLEIFRLCERDGEKYDQNWFNNQVLAPFLAEKEMGYLPSAVIGHGEKEGIEPESIALVDNLKLIKDTVYSDIMKISSDDFENKFKKRKYPNRSVELHPETKQLMALAFLGKTRPFHKLPAMEFKGEKIIPISILFEEERTIQQTIKNRVENQEKERELGDIWWIGRDLIDEVSRNIDLTSEEKQKKAMILLDEMLALLKSEGEKYINTFNEKGISTMKTFTEEEHKAILEAEKAKMSELLSKQFKEKHGVTPDEAMQKFTELQAKRIEDQKKIHQEKINRFCEDLKKDGFAPALVDAYGKVRAFISDEKPVAKFDENGTELAVGDYLDQFVKSIFKYAKDGKLVIPEQELAPQSFDEGDKGKETERAKFYEKNQTQFEKMGVSREDFLKYGE